MIILLVRYCDGDIGLNKELGVLNVISSISWIIDFASLGSIFPTTRFSTSMIRNDSYANNMEIYLHHD